MVIELIHFIKKIKISINSNKNKLILDNSVNLLF